VFTPYKNAWLRTVQPFDLRPYPIRKHLEALAPVPQRYRGQLPTLADLGFTATNLAGIAMPTGSDGAHALFDEFLSRIGDYGRRRDFPACGGQAISRFTCASARSRSAHSPAPRMTPCCAAVLRATARPSGSRN
jgi:deoxyribodipyrimidine photolyase